MTVDQTNIGLGRDDQAENPDDFDRVKTERPTSIEFPNWISCAMATGVLAQHRRRRQVERLIEDTLRPDRGVRIVEILWMSEQPAEDADLHTLTGDFLIKLEDKSKFAKPAGHNPWQVIHDGRIDAAYWPTRALALLHLAALNMDPKGRADDGLATTYAARMLGYTE